MYVVDRWVPAEVGYTLFIGWVITMAIIVAAISWFQRNGPSSARSGNDGLSSRSRKKNTVAATSAIDDCCYPPSSAIRS